MKIREDIIDSCEPIHEYFELTYCTYLTLPRSVLQSMPIEWQRKFVDLVRELDDRTEWRKDLPGNYRVNLTDSRGRCMPDKYLDYDRGRTRWPIKEKSEKK